MTDPLVYMELYLPESRGFLSPSVGKTFSFADNETKNAKGTSQRHKVK
jgi:hypothetical protein